MDTPIERIAKTADLLSHEYMERTALLKPTLWVGKRIAAGMYACTGVLSGLHLRNKTGKGSRVDFSMLESWLSR